MIEFLVIAWTIATPIAIWRLSTRASVRAAVAWIVLICWPVIFVLALRDVPLGERWQSLIATPIGALLGVPLLFVAAKTIFRGRRN